jgi:hypothetical protein
MKKVLALVVFIAAVTWGLPRLLELIERRSTLGGAELRVVNMLGALQAGQGKSVVETQTAVCIWAHGGSFPESQSQLSRDIDAFNEWLKRGKLSHDFETYTVLDRRFADDSMDSVLVQVAIDDQQRWMRVEKSVRITWAEPPASS